MSVNADEHPPQRITTTELKFCRGGVSYTLACPHAAQPLMRPGPDGVRPLSTLKLRCMFTCSYNRWEAGKDQAFLDRSKAMEPLELWKDYAQVLIVREDQVTKYMKQCGQHYIIVGLPASMDVQLKENEEFIKVLLGTLRRSSSCTNSAIVSSHTQ